MRRVGLVFVLMVLTTLTLSAAAQASGVQIPKSLDTWFNVVREIIVTKVFVLGGIIIIGVSGIWAAINKTWAPIAYAVIALLLLAFAVPLVTDTIETARVLSFE